MNNFLDKYRLELARCENNLVKAESFEDCVIVGTATISLIDKLEDLMKRFASYPEASTFEFLRDRAVELFEKVEEKREAAMQAFIAQQRKARTR